MRPSKSRKIELKINQTQGSATAGESSTKNCPRKLDFVSVNAVSRTLQEDPTRVTITNVISMSGAASLSAKMTKKDI